MNDSASRRALRCGCAGRESECKARSFVLCWHVQTLIRERVQLSSDDILSVRFTANFYANGVQGSENSVNIDLKLFDHIIVAGAGKASAEMALALEKILGVRITCMETR